jgi:hypothetical protein
MESFDQMDTLPEYIQPIVNTKCPLIRSLELFDGWA